jgi:hypothetical protein
VLSYEQVNKLRTAMHDMAGAFTSVYLSRVGEASDTDSKALERFHAAQELAREALEGGE